MEVWKECNFREDKTVFKWSKEKPGYGNCKIQHIGWASTSGVDCIGPKCILQKIYNCLKDRGKTELTKLLINNKTK